MASYGAKETPTCWEKVKSKLKISKKDNGNTYNSRQRANSTTKFADFRRRGRERIKKLHENVKKRCQSLNKQKKRKESVYSDDPEPKEPKKKLLARNASFSKFVKRFTPGQSKSKIVAGENDDFVSNQIQSASNDYYPYGDTHSESSVTDNENNKANAIWVFSIDSSTGQTQYKNVADGTKVFVKPRGEDVIILDAKTLEQTLDKPVQRVSLASTIAYKSPLKAPPKKYKIDEDLEDFLSEIGMIEKKTMLYENSVDYNTLGSLTEVHFAEIGFKLGERVKIMKAIGKKFQISSEVDSIRDDTSVLDSHSSLTEDEEEAEFYNHINRGRSQSLPPVDSLRERGISPGVLSEIGGGFESGASAATIAALTNFVDKILSVRDVQSIKSLDEDERISMTEYESDYEADRVHQQSIRQEERERKEKLLKLMKKRNITPNKRDSNGSTSSFAFELNDWGWNESKEQEPDISFDLVYTPDIVFDLEEPTTSGKDFTFLNDEPETFDFLVESSDDESRFFEAHPDEALDDQVYQLEQDIKTRETFLKLSGVEVDPTPANDKIQDTTTCTLDSSTATFDSKETCEEQCDASSMESEESSSSDETGGKARSKSFLQRLSKLTTDSGFSRIVSNEAGLRNINLEKMSRRSKSKSSFNRDEQSCRLQNYVILS